MAAIALVGGLFMLMSSSGAGGYWYTSVRKGEGEACREDDIPDPEIAHANTYVYDAEGNCVVEECPTHRVLLAMCRIGACCVGSLSDCCQWFVSDAMRR